MKAISLWQPWGSLWLSLVKLHETRDWHIRKQWKDWKVDERIAVHAAKRFEKDHDPALAHILRRTFGADWYRTLPTGALIGTILVTDCTPTDQLAPGADDFECGNFAPGRYAWRGEAPVIFAEPIPWRGSQGIFNVPNELIDAARLAA